MTRIHILAALAVILSAVPAASAQERTPRPLTLEEAIALARPASEATGIARAGVRRAEADVRRARSEFFPQLSGSLSYDRLIKSQFAALAGDNEGTGEPAPESCEAFTPAPGQPVDSRLGSLEESLRCLSRANPFSDLGSLPFGRANTWRWGIAASQTLFAGGRLRAGTRAAEAAQRSAEIGVNAADAQVILEVVEAYADAALADRLAAIAQVALDQADTTLVQTALRREVGTAPEFDLLRATVARDNLRPQVIQAAAQRAVADQRLRQLLNFSDASPLALVTNLEDTTLSSVPTLASLVARLPDTAADHRSTVRQAEEALRAQEALDAAARGERLPALSLSSQYGRVAYPSNGLPGWNEFYTNWNVAVALQVPLFTGGRLGAGHLAARASADEAGLRHAQAAKGAALDARMVVAQRDAAAATWAASTGTVAQAARAYEIAEVRYREGISTQTELLDARLALQQAEATRATAARDLIVSRVRLALLADLPLASAGGTISSNQRTPAQQRMAQPPASSSTGFP